MHAMSRCDSVSSFSHTGNIATFQTLKNKQNKLYKLTDLIGFGEFPSLSLESLFLLQFNMYVIFMMIINQVQEWINYDVELLPKRILAEIVYHQL